MMTPEVIAYPVFLVATYGAARVGSEQIWGVFAWIRVCTLAILLGLLAAMEVTMAVRGSIVGLVPTVAAALGLAGAVGLVGLHIMEWAEARAEARRPLAENATTSG